MTTHTDEALIEKLDGLPMPRPLGDPLMFVGQVFKWLIVIAILLVVTVVVVMIRDGGIDPQGATLAGALIFQTVALFLTFSLGIPDRKVNAIYLRNFRKDQESAVIREHLEIALGPDFRLSGIRDPRKRINYFLRPFILMVMIIKYASARYLGLEAEDDWKARIWASFAETRLLFIDLSVVTKYVEEEIRLCISTMPLRNIVFIVTEPVNEDEWKEKFCADYGLSSEQKDQLQLAAWQRAEASSGDFIEHVRQLISRADSDPEARLIESYDQVRDSILTADQRRSEQFKKWLKIGIGTILAFWALDFLHEEFDFLPEPLAWMVALAIAAFLLYVLVQLTLGIRARHRQLNLARQFSDHGWQAYFNSLLKTYALLFLLLGSFGLLAFSFYSDYAPADNSADEYDEVIVIEAEE